MALLTFYLYDANDEPIADALVSWRLRMADRAPTEAGPPVIPDRLLSSTTGQAWTNVDGLASIPLVPTIDLDGRSPYELTIEGWGSVEFIMPDADSDLFDILRAPASPIPSRALPDPAATPDGNTLISLGNRWQAGRFIYHGGNAPTAPSAGVTALWVDTSTSSRPVIKFWDGVAWVDADTPQAGEVDTAHLADGSVTHPKLAANAVESDNVAPDQLGGREIQARGLDSDSLFGDNVVTTRVIADDAVTAAKLAPGAVSGRAGSDAHIAAGSISTNDLADDAVTQPKIADDAVGHDQIIDGSIDSNKIIPASIHRVSMGIDSVGTTNIQDNAVTAPKIAPGVIGSGGTGHLAANSVDTAELADNAVTQPKIADNAVGTDQIADNAVTAPKIAPGAVGQTELAAGAVDTQELADQAVQRGKIADSGVGELQLGTDAVTTAKIEDRAVTAAKLAANIGLVGPNSIDAADLDTRTQDKIDDFQRVLGIQNLPNQGELLARFTLTTANLSVAPHPVGFSLISPGGGGSISPSPATFISAGGHNLEVIAVVQVPGSGLINVYITPTNLPTNVNELIWYLNGYNLGTPQIRRNQQDSGFPRGKQTYTEFRWENRSLSIMQAGGPGQTAVLEIREPIEDVLSRNEVRPFALQGDVHIATDDIANGAITPAKMDIGTEAKVRTLLQTLGLTGLSSTTDNELFGFRSGNPVLLDYVLPNDAVIQSYTNYAGSPTGGPNVTEAVELDAVDIGNYRHLHLIVQGSAGDPEDIYVPTSRLTGNTRVDVGDLTLNSVSGDIYWNGSTNRITGEVTGVTPRFLLVAFTNYPAPAGETQGGVGGQAGTVDFPTQIVQLWKRATTAPNLSELATAAWNGRIWTVLPSGWHILPSDVPSGSGNVYHAITSATYDSGTDAWTLGTWTRTITGSYNFEYTTSSDTNDPMLTTTSTPSSSSQYYRIRDPGGNWGVWLPIYRPEVWTEIAHVNLANVNASNRTGIPVNLPTPIRNINFLAFAVQILDGGGSNAIAYNAVNIQRVNTWYRGESETSQFPAGMNYLLRSSASTGLTVVSTNENPRTNIPDGNDTNFDCKIGIRGSNNAFTSFYFYRFSHIGLRGEVKVYML